MSITVVFDVPGMTSEHYDRVMHTLDAEGLSHPDGRILHLANPTDRGWLVVDHWESPEQLERFAGSLMPALASAGVTPPEPQVYATHRFVDDRS